MRPNDLDSQAALVVFSGGQDSATCLAWALERYERVETVGFDYGQTHAVEMAVRDTVRERTAGLNVDWTRRLRDDHVFDASVIGAIGGSRLTGATETLLRNEHLPDTFVPGRNLVFLTLAGGLAYRRGIKHIVTGVCETDFSGYPDCRDDTIKALQIALNLGTEAHFVIHTPLMWMTKAQTWALANELGGEGLVDIIRRETHTCYRGDRTRLHDWGFGCGECPACQLRSRGWSQFSTLDCAAA
jgi:7-cyano-7-deazaguanine synthase